MRRIVLVALSFVFLLLASDPFTQRQREFWSFQKVKPRTPPAVKDAAWVRSPIDPFCARQLEAKGIRPATPPPTKLRCSGARRSI